MAYRRRDFSGIVRRRKPVGSSSRYQWISRRKGGPLILTFTPFFEWRWRFRWRYEYCQAGPRPGAFSLGKGLKAPNKSMDLFR
jgi:hypothetical protein